MAFNLVLSVVLLCATAVQSSGIYTVAPAKDSLHHQPRLSNTPHEFVLDLLNLKVEDYVKGAVVTKLNDNTFIYGFEDRRTSRSAVVLMIGNQRLYVMPHARNLSVKLTEFPTNSEVLVTYEIDGGLCQHHYKEELLSSLSRVFWDRMFTPQRISTSKDEDPFAIATSLISQWTGMVQNFWSFGFNAPTQPVEPPKTVDVPRVVIDLSDATTYNRIAKSQRWRRLANRKVVCVSFLNKDSRWNGIYLHHVKLEIPSHASEFTVCHDETVESSKNVVVISLIGTVWVESFFSLTGIDTSAAYLTPVTGPNFFDTFKDLPSRSKVTPSRHDGDGFVLDVDYPLDDESPIEMYDNDTVRVFRYKEGEDMDKQGPYYVDGVKFGEIEQSLPESSSFVLLAALKPFASTNYMTLVTRSGFQYSITKWYSSTNKDFRPVNLSDSEHLATALSEIYYVFSKRNHPGPIDLNNADNVIDGDLICLFRPDGRSHHMGKMCKSLKDLAHTTVLLEGPALTILKYSADAPTGMLIIGTSIVELDTSKSKSDFTIYFEHDSDKPMSIVVSDKDNVWALKETWKGSNAFKELSDSMIDLPETSKIVDVDIGNTQVVEPEGIAWDHQYLESVWVLKSVNHPDTAIGSVRFHNCRILSQSKYGYTFIVAPTADSPSVAVVFFPNPDGTHSAVLVKSTLINNYSACAVETLEYAPTPLGAEDVRAVNFDTLFKLQNTEM
ncbi:uncharacterized protein BXIN_1893 [Babesia sp. Xinjiang]|uniref:uncharacterized protein n=1 Tax=Babesia sp. Xinjiang TaxID=462227 RepID=UPI000A21D05F|nr:uncharacterized protein BXIN_1893 [Babesia sp. Xinjiang]ORM40317.1 hypothetical protein BXIN_1893 [Babesia sp. Xinjiang]